MKALNPLVRIAVLALLATGCEFHVGEFDGDSSIFDDDEDAGADPTPTAKPTATAVKTATARPAEPDAAADDAGEVTDSGTSADTGTEPTQAPASASAPATTSPAASATMMPDPSSYLCVAPKANDSCDECLETNCKAERAACCGEACEELWPNVQQCMAMIANAGDPVQAQEDLDACISAFDPDGTSDMDQEFNNVLFCVNRTYLTPEDDSGHLAGDGTCTFECYGVTTLMED